MKRVRFFAFAFIVMGVGVFLYILISTILNARNLAPRVREQQLVYDIWAFAEEQYRDVFYPQSVDTIYLIGGVRNALAAKLTEVYFWPIDMEFKADTSALDSRLTGVIEILKNGKPYKEVEPSPYSLVYERITPKEVKFGAEAEAAYAHFQRDSSDITEELDAYYAAMTAYQQAYEDYLSQIKAGNLNVVPPESPGAEPPEIGYYVSKPSPAFQIELPPGDYVLRLKTKNGQIVENSEKKVEVIAPRREGIGYIAFSGDRWTKPVTASDPQEKLFVQPGKTIFLQAYSAFEIESYSYSKLIDPQQPATGKGVWKWILSQPIDDGELQLHDEQGKITTIKNEPYTVKQNPGSALGYTIIPFKAQPGSEETPTFSAYRVAIPSDEGALSIDLVNSGGQVISGSERDILPNWGTSASRFYLLSATPLLLGAIALAWRRMSIRMSA